MPYKKAIKKTGKILLYTIGVLLILVCLVFLFINLPVGKRAVKNRVQSYLTDKLKTKVVIGAVDYRLPEWIEIKNVYIEDQKKDTLIFGEQISADINMFKLLRGNTDIQKLFFKNIYLNVNRAENDSLFNYNFLINAFSGNKPVGQVNTDTAELKLTLDRLIFDNVVLQFKDQHDGSDFNASIKNLDATLNKFQPDRTNFAINNFSASGVNFFMNTYKEIIKDSSVVLSKQVDAKNKPAYQLFITANHFNLREVNVTVDDKISGLYYSNNITNLGLSKVLFNVHKPPQLPIPFC